MPDAAEVKVEVVDIIPEQAVGMSKALCILQLTGQPCRV